MEKKQSKKSPAPKKKAAPKKKIVKKAHVAEAPIMAPEATPYVAYHDELKSEVKVSFWSKVKNFLGF